MHSFVHAFLTHPPYKLPRSKLILSQSPGGGTSTYVHCQTADRKNSQFFNPIVHRCLWVKVHKIFNTCRAPRGLFTMKVWPGVTAENFERIAKKPGIFALVHAKARTACTSGVKGQGRTYTLQAIVLWFHSRFKRSEIRFRSGVISS